jgi:hypothetical protein
VTARPVFTLERLSSGEARYLGKAIFLCNTFFHKSAEARLRPIFEKTLNSNLK